MQVAHHAPSTQYKDYKVPSYLLSLGKSAVISHSSLSKLNLSVSEAHSQTGYLYPRVILSFWLKCNCLAGSLDVFLHTYEFSLHEYHLILIVFHHVYILLQNDPNLYFNQTWGTSLLPYLADYIK